jgi:hypothetical protein
MNRALFLLLFLPGLAAAQESQRPGGQPNARTDSRAMYEDIEVMRQLLVRKLHVAVAGQCNVCHVSVTRGGFPDIYVTGASGAGASMGSDVGVGGPGAAVVDFDGDGTLDLFVMNHHGSLLAPATVEGTYLKGYGVVFNVTLPPSARDDLDFALPAQSPKTVSEWEQARRELRGEKGDAGPAKKPTVPDVLTKVLADNGKHFGQLPENEKLTVIVTFRGDPPYAGKGAMSGGAPTGSGGMMASMGGGGPMAGSGSPRGGGMPAPGTTGGPSSLGPGMPGGSRPGIGAAPGDFASERLTQDRELELLGDLHVKRGNQKEAASAYERAKKETRDANRLRELAKKLAEVYLALGNIDAARKALEMPAAQNAPATPQAPHAAPAIRLPGKLILTAPKNLLDEVGAGRVSYADFQKRVTLDIYPFDITPLGTKR